MKMKKKKKEKLFTYNYFIGSVSHIASKTPTVKDAENLDIKK